MQKEKDIGIEFHLICSKPWKHELQNRSMPKEIVFNYLQFPGDIEWISDKLQEMLDIMNDSKSKNGLKITEINVHL